MKLQKKRKILYIVTQSEWGGAQTYIYDLAENLSPELFDIHVASGQSNTSELTNKLIAKHIPSYQLQHLKRSINVIKDLRAIYEIYKLIKKINPDVVHLNSSKVSIVGSIAARFSGVPHIIYTAHGWVFNEPNSKLKNLFYYLSEKITAHLKDDIICVSEFDKQVAERRKITPKHKLIAILNGVDLKKLHFYDKDTARDLLSQKIKLELSLNQPIIGTIGNLYKTKGHAYLIDAAVKLPNYLFIILGEGPEREHLENLIKKHRLSDRFIMPGSIKNGYQYLKAFDIFVLPSVKEGLPYTILEAIAAAMPIVATNVGGIPEILTKENLIPPRDVSALVIALHSALDKPTINNGYISIDKMIKLTSSLYL